MSKKSESDNHDVKQLYPENLVEPFHEITMARNAVEEQLIQMIKLKQQYENAIENYFAELEKTPSQYRCKNEDGTEEKLTLDFIHKFRMSFQKANVEQNIGEFVSSWVSDDVDECPEKSLCYRINTEPTIFNLCCYVCLSIVPLDCDFS